jgi:hypothetical protein
MSEELGACSQSESFKHPTSTAYEDSKRIVHASYLEQASLLHVPAFRTQKSSTILVDSYTDRSCRPKKPCD